MSKRSANQGVRTSLELLKARIREAGPGSAARIERALGRRPGWLRDRRRANAIEYGKLLEMLEMLGLDPVRFFRQALDGDEAYRPELLRGEPPPILELLSQRLENPTEGRRCVGEDYLEELEALRFEDPLRAIELAESAVAYLRHEALPRLLGLVASAYRMLLELDRAEHALAAGMDLAEDRGDDQALAELLQRLAYVVGDRGEHAEALRIAQGALVVYAQAGDLVGMGKAFVDRGIFLGHLGRYRRSNRAFKAGLSYLPVDLPRSRCAALQGLGVNHLEIDEPERALDYLGKARTLAQHLPQFDLGKLSLLQGTVAVRANKLDLAEQSLREAVDCFGRTHAIEAAAATCDLVRIQILQGRTGEAYETARTMLRLVEPLRSNRLASAAIADLLRSSAHGFQLPLVDRVRRKLCKARTTGSTKCWYSRL